MSRVWRVTDHRNSDEMLSYQEDRIKALQAEVRRLTEHSENLQREIEVRDKLLANISKTVFSIRD